MCAIVVPNGQQRLRCCRKEQESPCLTVNDDSQKFSDAYTQRRMGVVAIVVPNGQQRLRDYRRVQVFEAAVSKNNMSLPMLSL
jgi:hypothetical protein